MPKKEYRDPQVTIAPLAPVECIASGPDFEDHNSWSFGTITP